MAKLLTFSTEVNGVKVVLSAQMQNVVIAKCVLTWFAAQQTAHVWFAAPALHSNHGVTTFQKFSGTFLELQAHYSDLFHQLVWLMLPVVQGQSGVEMLLYKLQGVHSHVSALVRCLVALKKNMHQVKSSHDQKKDTHCRRLFDCRESATSPCTSQEKSCTSIRLSTCHPRRTKRATNIGTSGSYCTVGSYCPTGSDTTAAKDTGF